ncbi:DSBA-like thioredoxin domain-containing protein [Litoreibacter halocynthiae]|uniref:DSBA-like thioredoxin domain-containing protein n=2 Tax=Litoreibacter halocynthiae TaxID=1242689 RepID=A0A4R7LED8_9RHOB|nr:DSBA-like thioredoxin domain-containing protein [Litoreibacter halocynthiae]
MAIGAVGMGFVAVRFVPTLIPQKLEMEAMSDLQGFRKLNAGKSSAGSFDFFVGLDAEEDRLQKDAKLKADTRVLKNICGALYEGLDLKSGQVPMASFSDYYCPYCRVQTKRLAKLVETKGDEIAVAWHELPLLGENSDLAAKAALAAKRQGTYAAFHRRLMKSAFSVSPEYLSQLVKDLNINESQFLADMASDEVRIELENSAALSRAFAFVGTPALVIGRTVIQGQISDRVIERIVELEREEGWAEQCGYA